MLEYSLDCFHDLGSSLLLRNKHAKITVLPSLSDRCEYTAIQYIIVLEDVMQNNTIYLCLLRSRGVTEHERPD